MGDCIEIQNANRKMLPISAAFHASHLPVPDFGPILGNNECWSWALDHSITLNSNSSGQKYDGFETVGDLLQLVLQDIVQYRMDVKALLKEAYGNKSEESRILQIIGPCKLKPTLQQLFSNSDCQQYDPQMTSLRPGAALSRCRGRIAITGMAGRFPGADSAQELWQILENGNDMHTKVSRIKHPMCSILF